VVQAENQALQLHQVPKAKNGAPIAYDHVWNRPDHVRPLPRHETDGSVADLKQKASAGPVTLLAYADELPPAKRMERMRDTYKVRPWRRMTRNLVRVTRGCPPASSGGGPRRVSRAWRG